MLNNNSSHVTQFISLVSPGIKVKECLDLVWMLSLWLILMRCNQVVFDNQDNFKGPLVDLVKLLVWS